VLFCLLLLFLNEKEENEGGDEVIRKQASKQASK